MHPVCDAPSPIEELAGRYDAIVIGGGHNGLTWAAYPPKAGADVPAVERQDRQEQGRRAAAQRRRAQRQKDDERLGDALVAVRAVVASEVNCPYTRDRVERRLGRCFGTGGAAPVGAARGLFARFGRAREQTEVQSQVDAQHQAALQDYPDAVFAHRDVALVLKQHGDQSTAPGRTH